MKMDVKTRSKRFAIDKALVHNLISTQFPQWKDLAIRPVVAAGWDNRTFHLGEHMLVRMPSAEDYALQVEKEHYWLPKLVPLLPLQIPIPLAMGEPAYGYPCRWSIYRWLEGEAVVSLAINDLNDFAFRLAQFLLALQSIDSRNGPQPGPHNFYRGGSLSIYDIETRQALNVLKGKIDVKAAIAIWETALACTWQDNSVWVHGDISADNLLVKEGRLNAVMESIIGLLKQEGLL